MLIFAIGVLLGLVIYDLIRRLTNFLDEVEPKTLIQKRKNMDQK